ncbi:unnamed protein product [Cochlearia groenlandica]
MTTTSPMDPPPPRNPNHDPNPEPISTPLPDSNESPSLSEPSPMNPPPPRNPNTPDPEPTYDSKGEDSKGDSVAVEAENQPRARTVKSSPVPYTIPEWSGSPCHIFHLEILKEGSIVDKLDVYKKGAYLFGRDGMCDFALEHPSISRFHAVIQYKRSGVAYLFDLGSTHGTSINKNKVDKRVYVDLHVGDVIRFGGSTRLYIFQGPSELMPPEKDLQLIREAKMRIEMSEREASLRRAKQQASMADGVSWGMGEDAIEEEEDDVEEITWQTYTGELTPKQEKTKEKVLKRLEKIGHMRKEIAAIRAKDISQGGLTQGQQTQIARNEQRIAELMEELESLEETLNDSIRESLGAKTGRKPNSKKKGTVEEEEDLSSGEDDFYDRTKKKRTQKGGENQTVETVDSLLGKRDSVLKEIEEVNERLSAEKNKMDTENVTEVASGDSLDAYMTGLSSTLVQDKTSQIEQELSTLQTELDRILYLLKIADPTGAEVKKRELKSQQEPIMKKPEESTVEKQNIPPLKPAGPDMNSEKKEVSKDVTESNSKPEVEEKASETSEEKKPTVFVPSKPQWLGSSANKETIEEKKPDGVVAAAPASSDVTNDVDGFVDYKDRKKMIEVTTGLIIRKRKQEDKHDEKKEDDENSKEKQAEVMAQDAVALLLKHSTGHRADEEDEEMGKKEENQQGSGHSRKKKKKAKKVNGTDKTEFLDESDSWVPPKGQSGDGRTSLNDRLGY